MSVLASVFSSADAPAKVVRRYYTREIAALAICLCAVTGAGEVIDRILAVVGGQPVTLSDVTAARRFGLIELPPGTADPVSHTLERLIDRTLMLAEVDRFQPPEPDPSEMTVRVDALERRAGSVAAFDKVLAETGTTREQLRRHIRDDLRMATYLNQRFGTTDPGGRATAVAAWVADLRRRADVTILRK